MKTSCLSPIVFYPENDLVFYCLIILKKPYINPRFPTLQDTKNRIFLTLVTLSQSNCYKLVNEKVLS